MANVIADVALQYGVAVIGISGTVGNRVYKAHCVPFISEHYAGNDYDSSDVLIVTPWSRGRDPNEVANRVVRMLKEGKAPTIDGRDFNVRAETISGYSHTPNVVEMTRVFNEAIRP